MNCLLTSRLRRQAVGILLTLSPALPCLASDEGPPPPPSYTPDPVPKLYEEVSAEEMATAPRRNKDHLFTGGMLQFGQSRSTGSEPPRTAYGTGVEIGYTKMLDSWSQLEASLSAHTGVVGHATADITVQMGLLARLGYGYNLGGNVMGVLRGGVGALFAKYEDEVEGIPRKAPNQLLGTALQASYALVLPMSTSVSLTGAASWTNMGFNVSKVEAAGVTQRINKPVGLNVPVLELGVRVAL